MKKTIMTKKEKINKMLGAYSRSIGGILESSFARELFVKQDTIINKIDNRFYAFVVDNAYNQYREEGKLDKFVNMLGQVY